MPIVVGVLCFLVLLETFARARPENYSQISTAFPTPTPVGHAKKINCGMPNLKPDLSPSSSELTPQNLKAMAEGTDSDCDGISNLDDNCAYTYNPSQLDRNKNGVGDACEPKRPARNRMRPKPTSE